MKDVLKLLIVEDGLMHLEDVRNFLAKEPLPLKLQVDYVVDLENAVAKLPWADAVLTDVFFPRNRGEEEEPNGQVVVEECLRLGKPVVWITSTYHHGTRTDGVSVWGRNRGMEMFDCPEAGNREANQKPWEEAFYGLLYLLMLQDKGQLSILPTGITGPEGVYGNQVRIWAKNFISEEEEARDRMLANDPIASEMDALGYGSRHAAVRAGKSCRCIKGREIVVHNERVFTVDDPTIAQVQCLRSNDRWALWTHYIQKEEQSLYHCTVWACFLATREVVQLCSMDNLYDMWTGLEGDTVRIEAKLGDEQEVLRSFDLSAPALFTTVSCTTAAGDS
jgi:hypothetical protein